MARETMQAVVHRRPTAFRRFVADGRSRAEAVLAPLEPGVRLTGLTGGQFSLLDIVRACLAVTGPAAVHRRARLIEIDPWYCDVIRRRWTKWATGHKLEVGAGGLG